MKHKVIAKVLLVNGQGKILSVTRSRHDKARAGEWDFPGGNLDPEEGHGSAIVRETAEETGISIQDSTFVFAITDAYGSDLLLTFMFFVAHVPGEPAVRLSAEHEAFEWVAIDELMAKPEFPAFHKALAFVSEHDLLSE